MTSFLVERPDVSVVFTDFAVIDDSGSQLQVQRATSPEGLTSGDNMIPSFLFRRSVYECIGGYAEDLFLAEDFDYWLRILFAGIHMEPLHMTLYEYRLHANSLTDRNRERAFHASEQALLRHVARLRDVVPMPRCELGKAYVQLCALAKWQGNTKRSLEYLGYSLRYTPIPTTKRLLAFAEKQVMNSRS
jgi:hypothetical protein